MDFQHLHQAINLLNKAVNSYIDSPISICFSIKQSKNIYIINTYEIEVYKGTEVIFHLSESCPYFEDIDNTTFTKLYIKLQHFIFKYVNNGI